MRKKNNQILSRNASQSKYNKSVKGKIAKRRYEKTEGFKLKRKEQNKRAYQKKKEFEEKQIIDALKDTFKK
jgi:hypothetical protein